MSTRRPAWTVEVGLGLAWLVLLMALAPQALAHAGGSHSALGWCSATLADMPGMATAGGAAGASAASGLGGVLAAVLRGLPMWSLMAAAMMLPAALPAVRHVALNSLRWRRGRAMAEFLAVYLGIWLAFGALLLGALALVPRAGAAATFAGALALASMWQLTLPKRRALRACHLSSPLPPRGWRATRGVARFGLRNGAACVGSCWAMMLVAALAGSGRLCWMVGLTAVVYVEKLQERPRRAIRATAALLALGAIGTVIFAGFD